MDIVSLIIFIVLGLAVGYIGGFAGIGGAPFMVAFMVLILGYSQLSAQANVLTVMLGPMSLLGVVSLKEEVISQKGSIVIGVITYAVFSYLGADLAFRIGEVKLKEYFAILLFAIAAIQIVPKFFKSKAEVLALAAKRRKTLPIWIIGLMGAVVGLLGGFFGIGAGVLMVPIFVNLFNMHKNFARALSLAILLPPVSIGAFIRYNQEGLIDWYLVVIMFLSYFIANYYGAKLGTRISAERFKTIYSILLIAIGFLYILST